MRKMNGHQMQQYNQSSNQQMPKSILNDENNVIKLIRMFRSHECLWNPSCENYRNLPYKEAIWETIADQFGRHVTADQVKRKVKGLRNCFSTERSRVQKSLLDGRGEIYVPTLYYYKEFDFLQGIIKGMSKGCGNLKADFADEYDENNSPCEETMFNMNYTENNNDFSTNDTASNTNEDMKIFEPIVVNKTEFESPPHKKMRTRFTSSYSAKYTEVKQEPSTHHGKNGSQVQSLCEMIKVDLQDVSEELFYDAKWKIMDILREVHKKHLDDRKKVSTNKALTQNSRSPLEMADTSSAVVANHQYPQP